MIHTRFGTEELFKEEEGDEDGAESRIVYDDKAIELLLDRFMYIWVVSVNKMCYQWDGLLIRFLFWDLFLSSTVVDMKMMMMRMMVIFNEMCYHYVLFTCILNTVY